MASASPSSSRATSSGIRWSRASSTPTSVATRRTRAPARRRLAGMTQGPVRLDVSVGYALPRAGLPASVSFRRWVAAALAGRIREADLAIRLVDAKEGRALNRHYRGKDYATNVLSFPAELDDDIKLPPGVRMPLLGDL